MFCPCCGNCHLTKLDNNLPVADLRCDNCGELFELKTKKGNIGTKISDGAYSTMLERISSESNPDLLAMTYDDEYCINDLILIPKFFFVPQIIEKRKPLSSSAKRSGWEGCNILYSEIPFQGRIPVIQNSCFVSVESVIKKYNDIKKLKTENIESRGWLLDVLNCVNSIKDEEFTLQDIYRFSETLRKKHLSNNNIETKIRQKLQLLRDKGFIEFLDRGHYRKIIS